METTLASGSLTLRAHLAGVGESGAPKPGVVVVHGYPTGPAGTQGALSSMPELADRIAEDMGFVALAPCLRGIGDSGGEFSIRGWKHDILASVSHLREVARLTGVWLIGFGTGGALAVCAAVEDEGVAGVAALGSPADFDDWASDPRRLYQHASEVGLVRAAPSSDVHDAWAREMRLTRAVDAAAKLRPRALLVVHGTDDDVVPQFDARAVADAHTDAELRIIDDAGHRLRHDPRAIAVLLGWLDRQRHRRIVMV